ncbi:hypothetical protein GCM10009863_65350 [Streptomyces axinellae]|uniref:HTH araC/xylS-type domain-containing protein n=1 Tax=Streptomyces axinellae TaxID=552788 RepID=A0ABP6DBX0_9ACTN
MDEGPVLSSAGIASGIDRCLHMIRRDHGAVVANAVARRMVVPPHRDGGQAQFIRRPVPEPRLASTGTARAWALRQLERPITLREPAAQESMSIRTFTRRFREEAGTSPQQWLTQQRTEGARQLLEETGLSAGQVAQRAGFDSDATFRMHFQSALGVSPSAYRRTFRADADDGGSRAPAKDSGIRSEARIDGIRSAGENDGIRPEAGMDGIRTHAEDRGIRSATSSDPLSTSAGTDTAR